MHIIRSVLLTCVLFLLYAGTVHAQWIHTSGGPENDIVSDLAASHHTLYAGSAGPTNAGVFISTNEGVSWLRTDSTILGINTLVPADSGIFVGTGGMGIYRSTNSGFDWTAMNSGLTNTSVNVIAAQGATLFAGTYGGGLFRSTNTGLSWTEANSGLTNPVILSIALTGTYVFVGTYGGGVFASSNNGDVWTAVNSGLTHSVINALAIIGTTVFAGTGGGVFRSTNNGSNWTQVNSGLTDTSVFTFSVRGADIFVGTSKDVVLSTNNGDNWIDVSSGLPANLNVLSFAFDSTYLYAGLYFGGIWKRPLSQMVTDVSDVTSNGVPQLFTLEQNFPNPFNPSTTITFSLPHTSHVLLKLYDVLGREVMMLADDNLDAGTFTVQLDGSRISSGIYLYRLQAGSFIETKKLMLLR